MEAVTEEQVRTKSLLTYVGLFGSVLVYTAVAAVLGQDEAPDPEQAATLAPVLGMVSVAVLGGSFAVRSVMVGKATEGIAKDPTPEERGRVAARLLTSWLIGWAMCEAVVIFGLLVFFLGHDWMLFAPFAVAGGAALLVQAPRADAVETVLREARVWGS